MQGSKLDRRVVGTEIILVSVNLNCEMKSQ